MVREILLSELTKTRLDTATFWLTLQSVRSRGPIAVGNLGVNDRLFQKHGR